MVEWQIEALVNAGVTDIVLTIFYKEEAIKEFVAAMEKKYKVKIHMSVETVPMNTGGPIKLAEKYLVSADPADAKGPKSRSNTFFVLNSDIICDYPFEQMHAFHLKHPGKITILSYPVEEPSRYGVIVTEEGTGKVRQFVEKPQEWVGNLINAGIYVFDEQVLRDMEPVAFSLERETFPKYAAQGAIYVHELKGFWKDIGIPADFLACNEIYLDHFKRIGRREIDDYRLVEGGEGIEGVNLIHKEAQIEEGAHIGPFAVLHKGVRVGKGAVVSRSIVMDGTHIGEGSHVLSSILMFDIKVGDRARIEGGSVIAEKVVLADDSVTISQKVEPGLTVPAHPK
jgi:mannose-1-phosphate guanylyltransferase